MSLGFRYTPALLIALVIAVLSATGCDNSSKDNSDEVGVTGGPPIIYEQEVYRNPRNFLSVSVDVVTSGPVTAFVEYGKTTDFEFSTPPKSFDGGVKLTALGLEPDTTYYVRPVIVNSEGTITRGVASTVDTGAWPSDWPSFQTMTYKLWPEFTPEEVICFSQYSSDPQRYTLQICVNRKGTPVWYFESPDNYWLTMMRAISDGNFVSLTKKNIVIFDAASEILYEYNIDHFIEQTGMNIERMHHDLIEITEGRWAGALAFLISTREGVLFSPLEDVVDTTSRDFLNYPYAMIDSPVMETIGAEGIVVFEPKTGEVLWHWSMHGQPGDNLPFSPEMLPYTRRGLGKSVVWDNKMDWAHANALLHGIDADGEFFWVSLRHQDWLIKIDVESGGDILWRFGYQGDFSLVSNIESASPLPLGDDKWMFHQHAPEWISHGDGRYDFVMFDNGNVRCNETGPPYDKNRFSRVVRYRLDENTMTADIDFDYGSKETDNERHFYSDAVGDADMMPGADSVLFVKGWPDINEGGNIFISEITVPEGEEIWRLEKATQTEGSNLIIYRANYFPSIYDTTWWYEVER
jgi:Arylsulfotransferase (ASST)